MSQKHTIPVCSCVTFQGQSIENLRRALQSANNNEQKQAAFATADAINLLDIESIADFSDLRERIYEIHNLVLEREKNFIKMDSLLGNRNVKKAT